MFLLQLGKYLPEATNTRKKITVETFLSKLRKTWEETVPSGQELESHF